MTTFELELLKTAWPYIWTGMLGIAGWFIRSQATRLDKICESLGKFSQDVSRIEKEMASDRAENRHRIDRLIGDSDTRITRIEAVCETQHGITVNRRSTDSQPIHWAQTSDVSGNKPQSSLK